MLSSARLSLALNLGPLPLQAVPRNPQRLLVDIVLKKVCDVNDVLCHDRVTVVNVVGVVVAAEETSLSPTAATRRRRRHVQSPGVAKSRS